MSGMTKAYEAESKPTCPGVARLLGRMKLLLSLVFHYVDFISDITVTLRFYRCDNPYWTWLSVGFICAPLVVGFVKEWRLKDRLLALLNLMVLREFAASWREDGKPSQKFMLHKFMESMLESAPQIMLQSYVLFFFNNEHCVINRDNDKQLIAAIILGLCSVSIAVTTWRSRKLPGGTYGWRSHKALYPLIFIASMAETFIRTTTVVVFFYHFKAYILIVVGASFGLRLLLNIFSLGISLSAVGEALLDTLFITEDYFNTFRVWILFIAFNVETIVVAAMVVRFQVQEIEWWYYWAAGGLLVFYDLSFFLCAMLSVHKNGQCCFGKNAQVAPEKQLAIKPADAI